MEHCANDKHWSGKAASDMPASIPNYSMKPTVTTPTQSRKQFEMRLPSDQLRQILEVFKPSPDYRVNTELQQQQQPVAPPAPMLPHLATTMTPTPTPLGHFYDLQGTPYEQTRQRSATQSSDISMHASCTEFPDCTSDDPNSLGVIHCSPKDLMNAMHSPDETECRKRDRKELGVVDENKAGRSPRKVSKTSDMSTLYDEGQKENGVEDEASFAIT